jgi:hypothetical protein
LHAFQVIFGAMEEQEVDFAHESNIVSLHLCRNAQNMFTDNSQAVCRNYRC